MPRPIQKHHRITFGPVMPGWGSWDWIGADIAAQLSAQYHVEYFHADRIPSCELLFIVKHIFPGTNFQALGKNASIVYCPVDSYDSAAQIDADRPLLRRCSRIMVHCERLRRYFEAYAPVEYMDHHVKFASPLRDRFHPDGFILWAGVRTNLPALIEWVNRHPLPGELVVLTNLENPQLVPKPRELGFRNDRCIRIENWTPERHLTLTSQARAALDIKDSDFRSRHKPPAKAIDFIASGVPLAMNDSSPVEHLARMGFQIADPLDTKRWLSREYWEETRRFGSALCELCSLERIGHRYKRILDEVLAERH